MKAIPREARTLDEADPLRDWRSAFHLPEPVGDRKPVYLCGNSLGLQPRAAADAVDEVMRDWARLAVRGHFDADNPWMSFHEAAAPMLANLVGAGAHEVVAMNTLTVNLNLLMLSFYRPSGSRWKILIEADAFPSDRYAVQSQLAFHGYDADAGIVEWQARDGVLEMTDLEALLAEHGDSLALILLPGVQYYTGDVLPMRAVAAAAHRIGVPVGLDLAHAIGNVPMALHDWGVDFAVWCSYKYLNGGPGAIAGAYIHERHHPGPLPRLHGWWGAEPGSRFRMGRTFYPAPGADAWQQSNPPILALAPVIASLRLFDDVGLDALRTKSMALTGYLRQLVEAELPDRVRIMTPREPARQGCQLSLVVNAPGLSGREIFSRLEAMDVVGDWREPDVIRVAPVPFYNSYADVREFVDRLREATGAA